MDATDTGVSSAPHELTSAGIHLPTVIAPRPVATGTAITDTVDAGVRFYVDQVLRRVGVPKDDPTTWISTTDPAAVCAVGASNPGAIVNLALLNNLRRINTFLRVVNACLPRGGIYVCPMETLDQRRKRVFEKYPWLLAHLFCLTTFILHRVLPKLPLCKQIYFSITGGKQRVLSEAEALGRLICCGFAILERRAIDGYLYIVARKVAVTPPAVDPSYGPVFRARRIGQGGKTIRVFKLRTMYPYSEYLQQYVLEHNHLSSSGKFRNDFRVTGWGRICRTYWLDELPMLLNWLRGDLKLVGVRPLSLHYASLYPEELRLRRQASKPGLIPPFYADLPSTFDAILASEEAYLSRYERQPLRTDVRYFCRAVFNIAVRRARSA